MTEAHRLRELAKLVAEATGAEIAYVENPRIEIAENELEVANSGLRSLGLDPITLDEGLMYEVVEIAQRYSNRADLSKIPCTSKWRSQDARGSSALDAAD